MEVYITRHARNRMRLYGIEVKDVEATLAHPDVITAGVFGSQYAWKRIQERWLRVTFKDDGARRIVLTVTPKRHGAGEGHAD